MCDVVRAIVDVVVETADPEKIIMFNRHLGDTFTLDPGECEADPQRPSW